MIVPLILIGSIVVGVAVLCWCTWGEMTGDWHDAPEQVP